MKRRLTLSLVSLAVAVVAFGQGYYRGASDAPVGGVSYLVSEDAEGTGTPSGWTDVNTIAWDDTTNNLVGAESVSSGNVNNYTTKTFSGQSALSAFFAYEISSLSSARNIVYFLDSGGGQQIRVEVLPNGGVQLRQPDNDFLASGGAGTIAENTPCYIWVFATKGTGADAAIAVYVSATTTLPGSPTVSTTAGEWATDVASIRLRGSAVGTVTGVWDHIRVQTGSGTIGSAPP